MASSASPSETELSRSRAGSLLHGICIHPTLFIAYHAPCGSWLASDGVRPVTSMAPVPPSSLASQLPQVLYPSRQSHWHPWPLVGAGLPAMASFLSHQLRLRRRHRWQASSHRFCIHAAISLPHLALCGSWLASDGVLPVTSIAPAPPSSLASQLPQVLHSCRNLIATPGPLWELACQRWRPSCHINCACAAVIAGKPAPTGFLSSPSNSLAPQLPQGFASTGMLSLHLLLLPLRCRFRFVGHAQQAP
ncbi:hypothetical protein D3C73_93860 [compost metagenome]